MKQVYITCFVVVASLVVWLSGVGISQYLSDEPARRLQKDGHVHRGNQVGSGQQATSQGGQASLSLSASLSALEEEYQKNPASPEASINFANALFEEGMTRGVAESLKRAVGVFHEILERDPMQPDALLGLGTLSLHVGVADKAAEYYGKYLEVRPDDLSIAANMALAEARSGAVDSSLKRLETILSAQPDFVIAMVTKGLVLSEMGKKEEARALWLKAEGLEENELLKQRVSSLIVDSLKRESAEKGSSDNYDTGVQKSSLRDFFRQHEIIGPKIYDMIEEADGRFLVLVRDFPVDAMPGFAREKLETKIKEQLQHARFSEVLILDAKTRTRLIEVSR